MNLLDANDVAGTYPESWYAATTDALPRLPCVEVGDVPAQMFASLALALPDCRPLCTLAEAVAATSS